MCVMAASHRVREIKKKPGEMNVVGTWGAAVKFAKLIVKVHLIERGSRFYACTFINNKSKLI